MLLGAGTAMWLSLIVLSFCVGLFYGTGRQKRLTPDSRREEG